MNSQIFKDHFRKLDRSLRVDERKIAVIIDNCPAHPSISNLTNIQIVFLPPRTTLILQLMDEGVIGSALPRQNCAIVTQSLLEKQSLSRDFNFTSNEDTCCFLGGCNKGNCYQLFQENWHHL